MTTAGWLIIISGIVGFVFGYGWANSAKYAVVWEEYYRTKRVGGKEKVNQPTQTQDALDIMAKGPIVCSACRHVNFLVTDLDSLTAGHMCQAKPETEHCWDAIKGHYDIEHYQFCRDINHDGNCKLFEPKASPETPSNITSVPKESEITLTLPDGIFPGAIPGSTVHVTLKPANIPVPGVEVVSFTVESKEKP